MDKFSLLTAKNRRLCKIIRPRWDGTGIADVPYDNSKYFDVDEIEVNSLADMAELLRGLETMQSSCLVTGMLRDPTKTKDIRKTKYPARPDGVLVAGHHRLLMIDVDGVIIPREITSWDDAVDWYIDKWLPPEFRGASYVRQWSSKAGFERELRVHLWFELDRTMGDQKLHNWAIWWNQTKGAKVVDPQVYTSNQPLYTAAPIFEGVADPFSGDRVKLVDKQYPAVNLMLPPAKSAKTAPVMVGARIGDTPVVTAPGTGWQRYRSLFGDDKRGFYSVARDMIASYVRCTGGGDAADIIAEVRAAAASAYAKPSRGDVLAYLSGAKLQGLYGSALGKYATSRRRQPTQGVGVTLQDSVVYCNKNYNRISESNTYAFPVGGAARHDDLRHGLPEDLSYLRCEYFDNGRRKGKAQHTAKLSFTNEPGEKIDTRRLRSRYVDFTAPKRFKRTMLNQVPEEESSWYEEARKQAYILRDSNKTVREVLIGHVQRRWFDRSTGLRSHLYRYVRQIAYLVIHKSGRKQIFVVVDDKVILPQKRFERAINFFPPAAGAPRSSEIIFYHDPCDYYRAHLREKAERRQLERLRDRIVELRRNNEEWDMVEQVADYERHWERQAA